MKLIPLLLLALMAAVFIWTLTRDTQTAWLGYLRAFSEAAMVGALADWFAVVALFRHPLGIPIPHTAIIPRRKDQIGEAMARFVRTHFLTTAAIRGRLRDADAARAICRWCTRHSGSLADALARLSLWLATAFEQPAYRDFFARNILSRLRELPAAPAAGRLLELLAVNRHHQALFSEIMRLAISFLEDHKETLRTQMQRGSPWWVPEFVDQRIYDQILERLQTQLLAMVLDSEHPLRGAFDGAFARLAEELQNQHSARARRLEQIKAGLVEHPTVLAYGEELWSQGAAAVRRGLKENHAAFHEFFVDLIERTAEDALADAAMLATFDRWLKTGMEYLVEELGDEAGLLISDTVRRWDAQETAQRIELQIGGDLQYIRINGTLVGGLVGLAIHSVGRGLSG